MTSPRYPPQQSDLPSQDQPAFAPYSNRQIPPIYQPPPSPSGQTVSPSYVVTNYDARPVDGLDFVRFQFVDPIIEPQIGTFEWHYVVPEGQVATIRNISVSAQIGSDAETPSNTIFADKYGFPNIDTINLFLDIEIDGVSNPNLSNVPIIDAAYGDVSFDCYVQADAMQRVVIRIKRDPLLVGLLLGAYIAARGNLLNKTGRTLQIEPTPLRPIPVIDGGGF